jgi:hypothetical protein
MTLHASTIDAFDAIDDNLNTILNNKLAALEQAVNLRGVNSSSLNDYFYERRDVESKIRAMQKNMQKLLEKL